MGQGFPVLREGNKSRHLNAVSLLSAIWDEKPLLCDCSFQPVGTPQYDHSSFLQCIGLVTGAIAGFQMPPGSLTFTLYVYTTSVCVYAHIYVHSTYNTASKSLKPPLSGIKINAFLNITVLNA